VATLSKRLGPRTQISQDAGQVLALPASETGSVARTGDHRVSEVDWQKDDHNTLSLSWNRLRWNSP